MAEENPQNINPAVDPQVEDPPSTSVPASQIDRTPAAVTPSTNPEVPQPTSQQTLPIAPPPDEAFLEQQTAQENRWIQAAATNPEGINNRGSVVIDRGGGVLETINRDGSYEISSGEGTYRYDAAGQQTSYTSPRLQGFSTTVTSDGVEFLNYSEGPITSSVITKDGQPINTTISYDLGSTKVTAIQTVGGQPVLQQEIPIGNGQLIRTATVGADQFDPELLLQSLDVVNTGVLPEGTQAELVDLAALREERRAAFEQASDENIKLREELISAKQQTESGIPLSVTQLAAIQEQAQALEVAETALAQADEALAEADPTVVSVRTNPQVSDAADQDIIPNFSTTDFAPTAVTSDPEIERFQEDQVADAFVPVSEIDTGPAPLTAEEIQEYEQLTAIKVNEIGAKFQEPFVSEEARAAQGEFYAANPQVIRDIINSPPPPEVATQVEEVEIGALDDSPAAVDPGVDPTAPVDDLPEAFVYQVADDVSGDPIVLAQAEATATDVVLVDVIEPELIDQDADPLIAQPEADPTGGFFGEPTPVGGNFTAAYDPETGTYSVVDLDTGETVETGLSQQQATLAAEEFSLGDPQFPNETDALGAAADSDIIREPTDVDVAEAQFTETDTGFFELQEEAAPQPDEFGFVEADDGFFVTQDEIEAGIDQQQFEGETDPEEFVPLSEIEDSPEPVLASDAAEYGADAEGEGEVIEFTADGPVARDANEATAEAGRIEAQRQNLRNQQSIREQRGNNVDSADWRVRLRLAPAARYLYLDNEYGPGILEPLQVSDGVIFPYTPTVQTVYKADYSPYNLTHSNYKGYFYQSSYVEDINITGTFTAQDSNEAAYLLAVIHFFRSATKMFYGQDPQRGAPPPLVFLSAFGQFQYVDAPCVISQFNYNLPADVDYIRARSPNQDGTNLLKRRIRQNLPTNAFSAALQRLKNARTGGLPVGGEPRPPAPPTLGLGTPTYVPTKMEITVVLHPMQSRQQVSQQFSVKEYGPGRLTPKGFW